MVEPNYMRPPSTDGAPPSYFDDLYIITQPPPAYSPSLWSRTSRSTSQETVIQIPQNNQNIIIRTNQHELLAISKERSRLYRFWCLRYLCMLAVLLIILVALLLFPYFLSK